MYITLYKSDRRGNVHYYTLHNRQGNLFTPYSLTLTWGPSVSNGREKLVILETRKEMDDRIRYLLRRRMREGYSVLYSYFRKDEHRYVRGATISRRTRSAAS